MGIEIEKKYRLTTEQRAVVLMRIGESPGIFESHEFEENVLYRGGPLDQKHTVLRLRRTENGAWLTYKNRVETGEGIKHQTEHESGVDDAEVIDAILKAIGFYPSLIYEKRRSTWNFDNAEVVIDELPFGNFMEIEGTVEEIGRIERALDLLDLEVEHASYPQLTKRFGVMNGEMIEARFAKKSIKE